MSFVAGLGIRLVVFEVQFEEGGSNSRQRRRVDGREDTARREGKGRNAEAGKIPPEKIEKRRRVLEGQKCPSVAEASSADYPLSIGAVVATGLRWQAQQ